MKNLLLILLVAALSPAGFGQKYSPPWGLNNFGDSLFVDQSEILVGEWLDYIYYHDYKIFSSYISTKNGLTEAEIPTLKKVKINESLVPSIEVLKELGLLYLFQDCKSCELIDFRSLSHKVLLKVPKDSVDNKDSYERLKRNLRRPITGISYEQAVEFCKWRTELDRQRYNVKVELYGVVDDDPITFHLEYSLPSLRLHDRFNPERDSTGNKKGVIPHYNYKNAQYSKKGKSLQNMECGKTIMQVGYFNDEVIGENWKESLLDFQGNAAEMTNEEGVAKGGSYFHFAKDAIKGAINNYNKPQAWLGFRCFGRIKTTK